MLAKLGTATGGHARPLRGLQVLAIRYAGVLFEDNAALAQVGIGFEKLQKFFASLAKTRHHSV